jgi:Tol biopolymer transport system component
VGAALLVIALAPTSSWATYPGANGRIAYNEGELFTISPGGGDPDQLTRNAVTEDAPSWSPDGRKIAFSRWSREGQNWDAPPSRRTARASRWFGTSTPADAGSSAWR